MATQPSVRAADRYGHIIGVGDLVRVSRAIPPHRAHPEYRRSFRRWVGRVVRIVGWDATGDAWIPVRPGEVLSVDPKLLVLVRRAKSAQAWKVGRGLAF